MIEKINTRLTRRQFVKACAVAGASLYLPWKFGVGNALAVAIPGGTLDLSTVDKYVMPMIIPPAMPLTSEGKVDYYEIAVRQFKQQILPQGMPMTTVWSYGSANHPGTFNYPAFTIEAKFNKPVRVKWINDLKDAQGNYLPHLLPVDPTLHWANPPGGEEGRDMQPIFKKTPGPYTGPVPVVTHVHGAHADQQSDGYPEAWYLPNANNIPGDYAMVGTWYEKFKPMAEASYGQKWEPGTAVFQYQNDQPATTLWYHDHSLGLTRLNVYAGPAGFYLIRRGPSDLSSHALPGPAPGVGDDPFGTYYEIPIAIQDRSFNDDGSLFYPDTREFFDGIKRYIPKTDVPPIWNPEFFGNTMVVNGRAWPYLDVKPRRYRLRLLNGCNSRFLILKFSDPNLTFWQIGAEGGFLPKPVQLDQLLMAPAERADVIVDFSNATQSEVTLLNLGPDEPFGGGTPGVDFDPADPGTTGQVMQFRVGSSAGRDKSLDPAMLTLPSTGPLGGSTVTRKLSLNEEMSEFFDGPVAALLGTLDGSNNPVALKWMDNITENPALGATETWELYNFTADAHPIHIHLVQFEVVNRQALATDAEGVAMAPAQLVGDTIPPEAWESGYKDTVIVYPGQVTRVKAKFDKSGLYVWHCHIVEHEDNEMMRPYYVGPISDELL